MEIISAIGYHKKKEEDPYCSSYKIVELLYEILPHLSFLYVTLIKNFTVYLCLPERGYKSYISKY